MSKILQTFTVYVPADNILDYGALAQPLSAKDIVEAYNADPKLTDEHVRLTPDLFNPQLDFSYFKSLGVYTINIREQIVRIWVVKRDNKPEEKKRYYHAHMQIEYADDPTSGHANRESLTGFDPRSKEGKKLAHAMLDEYLNHLSERINQANSDDSVFSQLKEEDCPNTITLPGHGFKILNVIDK